MHEAVQIGAANKKRSGSLFSPPPEFKLDAPNRALYLLGRIGKVCWVCQRAEVGRLICRLFCSPVGKKI
jgi:hypothetical protein